MKKLIPALALLLVSAVMLGTSSFAWFSMNTEVAATGMQITAVTNANLYIKEGLIDSADSIDGVVASMATGLHNLSPANLTDSEGTVTVQIPTDYTGGTAPTVSTAGHAVNWTPKGTFTKTTATSTLAVIADGGIGNYIAAETMTIVRKAQSASTYDVDAVVTVTLGASSELNKALHCGFLVGNTFTQTAAQTPAASGSATFSFNDLLDGVADNAVQKITFVIWYEGEDANCTSNNAITVSTNTVSIAFTSRPHS